MLNYAETASSSTNVLPTPVPCNQPQEQSAEPLPEVMQPQQDQPPDWTIGKDFGELLYQGKPGEIRVPGMIWMCCDAAFAQGFQRGRELILQHEDGDWYVLTDQEFTALIAQHLPANLPLEALAPWKRGFIFGWCITWHYQPFLDEEAEAYGEDESEAASCEGMY